MSQRLQIWVGVNNNGFISIHGEEPHRDNIYKKWVSNALICNSKLYKEVTNLVEKSKMSWESDSALLEIQV